MNLIRVHPKTILTPETHEYGMQAMMYSTVMRVQTACLHDRVAGALIVIFLGGSAFNQHF